MGGAIMSWAHRILTGHFDEEVPQSLELAGLSIGEALQAHTAWIHRFDEALKDKSGKGLDPEDVSHDDRCLLGKWIHADHTHDHFNNSPEFRNLKETHAVFHRNASLVISALRQGDQQEARVLLDMVKAKSRQIRVSLAKLC